MKQGKVRGQGRIKDNGAIATYWHLKIGRKLLGCNRLFLVRSESNFQPIANSMSMGD